MLRAQDAQATLMEDRAMTTPPHPPDRSRSDADGERAREAVKRWEQTGYPLEVIERLRWNRRYSIIRIGVAAFAFSSHDDYVAGLRAAWAARIVPDHGPSSILGIDLPDVVSSLSGVDIRLSSGSR
jgi:hypothetical protein